jgi:membrane protease YdiL (CAAX protease family)
MMPSRPGEDPSQPYPGLGASFLLILVAIFASVFTGVAFFGLGALAAYGIGRAIGVGAVASLAAQRVGEPQAQRLGLRRLEPEAIPVILCLVPAMLLLSELDNHAYDWAGDEPDVLERLEQQRAETAAREDADGGELAVPMPLEVPATAEAPAAGDRVPEVAYDEEGRRVDGADPAPSATGESGDGALGVEDGQVAEDLEEIFDADDPFSLLQAFVVMVGIIPIVDCFLVFGVIQQGLVRRLGAHRGIAFAALFWMLLRPVPLMGTTQFLVVSVGTLGLGGLLGLVRLATASIAGPMLLASGWAAVQFVALATTETMPLPGLNVPGTHLPLLVLAGSLVTVVWGALTLLREAEPLLAEPPVAASSNRRSTHGAEIRWFPGYEEQQDSQGRGADGEDDDWDDPDRSSSDRGH